MAVHELRRYLLHPGTREAFVAHFEGHLYEPQQAAGMELIGQFTDNDRPDVFVWLRGFPGMEERRAALESFYFGPVWAAHRDVMNPMMVDSDNVLLLRPLLAHNGERATGDHLALGIWPVVPTTADGELRAAADRAGVVAAWRTETAENTFPRLPVRDDIHAYVVLARSDESRAMAAPPAAVRCGPPEHAALRPTPRSALR